jgi:hypothetical protein
MILFDYFEFSPLTEDGEFARRARRLFFATLPEECARLPNVVADSLLQDTRVRESPASAK